MKATLHCHNLSAAYRGDLTAYAPFPTCEDRAFWDHIDSPLKQQLIEEGEAALETEFPSLSATAYMAFCRTGNRADYEKPYFAVRHLLPNRRGFFGIGDESLHCLRNG